MISIIIPTLNEESVIAHTLGWLRSAIDEKRLAAAHQIEIIISDGKSTDGTPEIARAHGADIVVEYRGMKRQTIAAGRNAGAAAAHGEFLAFMDADCTILDPAAFFDKVLWHFRNDPELVALNVAIRVLPEYENWMDWVVFNLFNDYVWLVNNVLHVGMSAGEFQMIRREAFDKAHGYDETLVASEDLDLFRRLSKIGKVRYEKGLTIYHTGRRGHKIGWPRLLSQWIGNSLSVMKGKKAVSKEWTVIR